MSIWIRTLALMVSLAACATHVPSAEKQQSLEQNASATLAEMQRRDPGLSTLLQHSVAFAVFPSIGAAGALLVGGAYGKGILYEHGVPTGYVEIRQGSVGPQLGGQSYSELLVVNDPQDLDNLKSGSFELGGDATVVALSSGAAESTQFTSGTAVFVMPRGGMMAGISVSGQTIAYRPLRSTAG